MKNLAFAATLSAVFLITGCSEFEGDTGPQGIAGPAGEKGEQGELSKEDIAFIEQLKIDVENGVYKGEKGDTGPQGIAGPAGEKGEQGEPGVLDVPLLSLLRGMIELIAESNPKLAADLALFEQKTGMNPNAVTELLDELQMDASDPMLKIAYAVLFDPVVPAAVPTAADYWAVLQDTPYASYVPAKGKVSDKKRQLWANALTYFLKEHYAGQTIGAETVAGSILEFTAIQWHDRCFQQRKADFRKGINPKACEETTNEVLDFVLHNMYGLDYEEGHQKLTTVTYAYIDNASRNVALSFVAEAKQFAACEISELSDQSAEFGYGQPWNNELYTRLNEHRLEAFEANGRAHYLDQWLLGKDDSFGEPTVCDWALAGLSAEHKKVSQKNAMMKAGMQVEAGKLSYFNQQMREALFSETGILDRNNFVDRPETALYKGENLFEGANLTRFHYLAAGATETVMVSELFTVEWNNAYLVPAFRQMLDIEFPWNGGLYLSDIYDDYYQLVDAFFIDNIKKSVDLESELRKLDHPAIANLRDWAVLFMSGQAWLDGDYDNAADFYCENLKNMTEANHSVVEEASVSWEKNSDGFCKPTIVSSD